MSSLHDKMYNHEVTPPSQTWDKIATALDESEIDKNFPQLLYNMELTPPAAVWEKIDESFIPGTAKMPAPVRSMRPVLRYTAAAIIIGLVAFIVIKLSFNNNKSGSYPVVTANKPADTNAHTDIKRKQTIPTLPDNEIVQQAESSSKRAVATRVPHRNELAQTKSVRKAINISLQNNKYETDLSQSIYAYADHVPDISDRYVMLLTPDGNIIRMAKKWSNLVCCVSGEEQDPGCKNQIKKWQEKIASSSLAPSPGNFMDILGLVNSLNDTNGL